MKTQTNLIGPQDADYEASVQPQAHLQEQFIKQVRDDSLSANQVLAEQSDSMQKEDHAHTDSATLFVP